MTKVIHVVESLDRGAIEGWLVRMLRHARARGVELDWTFYCSIEGIGPMDDEARALGARVVHSPVPLGRKTDFIRALRDELYHGRYDVLHCHHDLVSAVYLTAAFGLPIVKALVHVHNADETVPTPNRFKQSILRPLLRRACLTAADGVVGNSNHTLDTFLAGRRRRGGRDVVHYYGIDPVPFERARRDRRGFRAGLGVADRARILLFAGRMVPEKNPMFALDVLAELHRLDPTVVGLFVGAGSLEDAIRQRAAALGIERAVRHLGWRGDVPEIMCCCDWFILPHPEQPMEGFGIAVVEAQLAGLRLLLSTGVSDDPLLPTACFRRHRLSAGARSWAESALGLLDGDEPAAAAAFAALRRSPMDMDRALDDLMRLHA